MPVWHAAAQSLVRDGKLAVVGVVQEQHAERSRLYAQWQGLDWPLLHDPINKLGLRAVPVILALDEHGVLRESRLRPDVLGAFVEQDFPAPDRLAEVAAPPDPEALAGWAERADDPDGFRESGDAWMLWGEEDDITRAIDAYRRAVALAPEDGRNYFRLGAAFRARYDSSDRRPGDFQAAVAAWTEALSLNPNQYIWRRRIEQYGPRLEKPYPFYDWVDAARQEIVDRGDVPVELRVPLTDTEVAAYGEFTPDGETAKPPGARDVAVDVDDWITMQAAVVPSPVAAGAVARVHFDWIPSQTAKWNNEATPMQVWLEPPDGWQVDRRAWTLDLPAEPETAETRRVEFEVEVPAEATDAVLTGFALYHACHRETGECRYLRREIRVPISVRGE